MKTITVNLTSEELETICYALHEQSLVEKDKYVKLSTKMTRCKLLLQAAKENNK